MRGLVLAGWLLYSTCVFAQPPIGGDPLTDVLELQFEDALRTNELNSNLDLNQWLPEEVSLVRRRLNLNRASRWALLTLPLATTQLVDSLIAYRAHYGNFTSIYELQAVPGVTEELFLAWANLITVSVSGAAPIAWEDWRSGNLTVIQRFGTTLPLARGYTENLYAGAPWQRYTQARYRYGDRLSIGLVGESDAGETIGFAGQPGYDYLSGHAYVRDWGPFRALAFGDYHLQLGQGLLFARTGGMGRGAGPVLAAYSPRLGVVPNVSVNESLALRGAAAELQLHSNWQVLAFVSHRRQDATTGLDTLGELASYNVRLSGLHRTETEQASRNQLTETLGGAAVQWETPWLRMEWLHSLAYYNPPKANGEAPEDAQRFAGENLYATSLSGEAQLGSSLLFGELAYSNTETGGMIGVLAALAPRADLAVHLRWFQPGFETLRGYVLAQNPSRVRNEQGLYLGVYLRPATQWRVHTYLDVFRFPKPGSTTTPGGGAEGFLQVNYRPQRYTEHYLRVLIRTRPEDAPNYLQPSPVVGTQAEHLVRIRLHTERRLGWHWQYQARLEGSWYRLRQSTASDSTLRRQRGWLAYLQATYSPTLALRLSGRLAWFFTDGGESQIYAYEQTPPTQYTIPGWTGRGIRAYLLTKYRFTPRLEGWVRLAMTHYTDRTETGSGYEERSGSTLTDLTFQLRYSLFTLREPD